MKPANPRFSHVAKNASCFERTRFLLRPSPVAFVFVKFVVVVFIAVTKAWRFKFSKVGEQPTHAFWQKYQICPILKRCPSNIAGANKSYALPLTHTKLPLHPIAGRAEQSSDLALRFAAGVHFVNTIAIGAVQFRRLHARVGMWHVAFSRVLPSVLSYRYASNRRIQIDFARHSQPLDRHPKPQSKEKEPDDFLKRGGGVKSRYLLNGVAPGLSHYQSCHGANSEVKTSSIDSSIRRFDASIEKNLFACPPNSAQYTLPSSHD